MIQIKGLMATYAASNIAANFQTRPPKLAKALALVLAGREPILILHMLESIMDLTFINAYFLGISRVNREGLIGFLEKFY